MKNLLILIALFISINATAKKVEPFQGKIIYDFEFTGENAEMMGLFMFTKYEFYFGENSTRLHLEGGMAIMLGDFIVNEKSNESYTLDAENKIAYSIEENTEEEKASPKSIVKTKEKEKILGYKCSKYEVTTVDENGENSMTEYWITSKLMPPASQNLDMAGSLFLAGVEGLTLKIVLEVEGMKIIQTASEINNECPDASVFNIPSDYEVKDFSESPFMKMSEDGE